MSSIYQKMPFNYQYYVGLSNSVDINIDSIQINGPATNALLQSLTIPSRTLAQNGQAIHYGATGAVVNSVGILTYFLNFAGVNIMTAIKPIGGGVQTGWYIQSEIFRLNDNSLVCNSFLIHDIETNVATATVVVIRGTRFILTPVNFNINNILELRATVVAADAINISQSYINVQ